MTDEVVYFENAGINGNYAGNILPRSAGILKHIYVLSTHKPIEAFIEADEILFIADENEIVDMDIKMKPNIINNINNLTISQAPPNSPSKPSNRLSQSLHSDNLNKKLQIDESKQLYDIKFNKGNLNFEMFYIKYQVCNLVLRFNEKPTHVEFFVICQPVIDTDTYKPVSIKPIIDRYRYKPSDEVWADYSEKTKSKYNIEGKNLIKYHMGRYIPEFKITKPNDFKICFTQPKKHIKPIFNFELEQWSNECKKRLSELLN